MKPLTDNECILHEPKILKRWAIHTEAGAITTIMFRIDVGDVDIKQCYLNCESDTLNICALIAVSVYNNKDHLEYRAIDYEEGYAKCDHNGCCYSLKLPDDHAQKAINMAIQETKRIKIA